MRKAAKVSPEDLWNIFKEQAFREDGCLNINHVKSISNDLKVEFDFENCYWDHTEEFDQWEGMLGYRILHPLSYIGITAGGDWEHPVYFIVYLDQDTRTLRAYIPKEGNTWNYNTKQALGNDDVADTKFLKEFIKKNDPKRHEEIKLDEEEGLPTHFDDPCESGDVLFDKAKIRQDIRKRIEVVK